MSTRGPRLEFAVGAFLLLALASLLVLAIASTNGRFGFAQDTYPLKARFTNLGQLRPMAPVKIGGVAIGKVESIQLDPQRLVRALTLNVVAPVQLYRFVLFFMVFGFYAEQLLKIDARQGVPGSSGAVSVS